MSKRAMYRRRQKQEQKEAKKAPPQPLNFAEEIRLKERITWEVDQKLGDRYYQKIYPKAYEDGFKAGYQEGLDFFDLESQSIICIGFGLALRDKFPRWGADAIESLIQDAINWNQRYVKEFHKDLDAYKLHYGVVVGKKFELDEVDDDDVGQPGREPEEVPG